MGSKDIQCKFIGYCRIFDGDCWVGSSHLQHGVVKRITTPALTFVILSKSGEASPEHLVPWPHKYGRNEDDEQVFVPLCDESLLLKGDDEMYDVMLVKSYNSTDDELHCERLDIGQIHVRSYDRGFSRPTSISLHRDLDTKIVADGLTALSLS